VNPPPVIVTVVFKMAVKDGGLTPVTEGMVG
jgi:hypothetical protein